MSTLFKNRLALAQHIYSTAYLVARPQVKGGGYDEKPDWSRATKDNHAVWLAVAKEVQRLAKEKS